MTPLVLSLTAGPEHETEDALLIKTEPAVMTEQSLRNFLLVSFFDMAHSL